MIDTILVLVYDYDSNITIIRPKKLYWLSLNNDLENKLLSFIS